MSQGDQPADFLEVKLQVPREHLDAVCNFVIEQISAGLVLDEEEGEATTDITFYVAWDRQTQYRNELETYLADILGPNRPVQLKEKRVANIEWVEHYKASIVPLVIADDIVVRPRWAESPIEARYEIVLEPRMAFGTGTHETTRTCLSLLRKTLKPGDRFLDLGTGSGILAILASHMGATYLKAIDYDQVAVDNCRENFELNKVETPHEILFGSIGLCDQDAQYDVVCANIIKSTILPMIPRLIELTKPGGSLILSGLLDDDQPEIAEALRKNGQPRFAVHPDNRWHSVLLRRQTVSA